MTDKKNNRFKIGQKVRRKDDGLEATIRDIYQDGYCLKGLAGTKCKLEECVTHITTKND